MGGPPAPAAAFGAHALPGGLERLRRLSLGLGRSWAARRAAGLIRRALMAARPAPYDVEPFPGQRARLYPADNRTERRVFAAAQFWDWAERQALAAAVAAAPGRFRFVDAGANVGLYTLAVRAMCRPGQLQALAIEPDPVNLGRLRFNLAASDAEAEVAVAPVALAAGRGAARLAEAGRNRGEIALAADGKGAEVETWPLLDLIQRAGFDRIDALKIDIEGHEAPVLAAFLAAAPRALRPRLVLIEAPRGHETAALALLRSSGYTERSRTKLNAILQAPDGAAEPT